MMDILLIAATEAEIAPLIKHIVVEWECVESKKYIKEGKSITILPTGVGMLATSYLLAKELVRSNYDLVVNVGVAGSYNRGIQIGEVVFVKTEQMGDFGAEDRDGYIDVFELGLVGSNDMPYNCGKLENPTVHSNMDLRTVAALTNNMVSGKDKTIQRLTEKHGADIETMEGAAVHYICLCEGVNFAQIRSISNYVEPRNRDNWQLSTAITNLNTWLIKYLDIL